MHQAGRSRGPKGPGAVVYSLNPESGWVVGIDVGSHWVRAALADITGTVRARRDERTHRQLAAATVAQISALAHSLAADRGIEWSHVTHAAVGLPACSTRRARTSRSARTCPAASRGWSRRSAPSWAPRSASTTTSTWPRWASAPAASGGASNSFVFLWVGTGIGLGIVVDGQLYRGAAGAAGEIAYLPVGPGDPHDPAYRRRGQLEESASAAAAQRLGGCARRRPRASSLPPAAAIPPPQRWSS